MAVLLVATALGGTSTALLAWLVVCVLGVGVAVAVGAHRCGSAWTVVAAALFVALTAGDLLARNLWLANLSFPLAGAAALVALAFARARWRLGLALLVVTLLIKPLLVPLLLVPVVARRWRDLAVTVLPALVALGLTMALVPGGRHYPAELELTAGGSVLHGARAVFNLSLSGVAAAHHAPLLSRIGRPLVAALAAAIAWRGRRDVYTLGAVALLGVFLVGSLAEVHYLPVVIPLVLAALSGSPRRAAAAPLSAAPLAAAVLARALLAAAVLLAAVPLRMLPVPPTPAGDQLRLLTDELLLLAALAVRTLCTPRSVRSARNHGKRRAQAVTFAPPPETAPGARACRRPAVVPDPGPSVAGSPASRPARRRWLSPPRS